LIVALHTRYTALGGLRVVVYTEVLQTVALLLGGVLMMAVAFHKVDGWGSLKEAMINATGDDAVPKEYFHLMRPTNDKAFPWTGMLFGMFASSIWYWCTDQVIVQRVLSARKEKNGRMGCIIAVSADFHCA
jgi:SSS family solute:Na+ symporter